jgi:hypothetical protein
MAGASIDEVAIAMTAMLRPNVALINAPFAYWYLA